MIRGIGLLVLGRGGLHTLAGQFVPCDAAADGLKEHEHEAAEVAPLALVECEGPLVQTAEQVVESPLKLPAPHRHDGPVTAPRGVLG